MGISEKVIAGLSPLVVVLCHFLGYKLFKRKRGEESTETINERNNLLHTAAAAIWIGNVLSVYLERATLGAEWHSLIIFPMIGFVGMLWYSKLTNRAIDPDTIINDDTLDLEDYTTHSGMESGAEAMRVGNLEYKELKYHRRPVTLFIYNLMLFLNTLNGIFLYYVGANGLTLFSFYLDQIMQSICAVSLLIYCILPRKFWFLSAAIFSLSTLSGCMPIFVDLQQYQIDAIVAALNSPWLTLFIGTAAGILLWIGMRFVNMDKRESTTKERIVTMIVFSSSMAVTWLVGLLS